MVLKLTAQLEAALSEKAQQIGLDPETLAINTLQERFLPKARKLEPQDDWERGLASLATECHTSLSNEALSSEGLYE